MSLEKSSQAVNIQEHLDKQMDTSSGYLSIADQTRVCLKEENQTAVAGPCDPVDLGNPTLKLQTANSSRRIEDFFRIDKLPKIPNVIINTLIKEELSGPFFQLRFNNRLCLSPKPDDSLFGKLLQDLPQEGRQWEFDPCITDVTDPWIRRQIFILKVVDKTRFQMQSIAQRTNDVFSGQEELCIGINGDARTTNMEFETMLCSAITPERSLMLKELP